MNNQGTNHLNDIQTGIPLAKDACVVIVKTEWNKHIVDKLEESCRLTLTEYGIGQIETHTVPGAFEIPFAIRSILQQPSTTTSVVIALGCIIKGGTPHFDFVAKAVTDGIVQLNLTLTVPVIFGVLTVNKEEEAFARIGGEEGDKGKEAALTALKMLLYSFR